MEAGAHHPRPHHRARVLVRRVHPLAAVGRDPQPVEPRVRRRRLVGRDRVRRWRPARRRWPAARTSAARSGSRRRSTAWSDSSRRTAACRRSRRSTSTTTVTAGRWRGPWPTAALFENVLAGPHPARQRLDAAQARASRAARGDRGAADRASRSTSATGRSTPRCARNTLAAARRSRDAGAIVEEVELRLPAADVIDASAAIHFARDLRALDRPRGRRSTAT